MKFRSRISSYPKSCLRAFASWLDNEKSLLCQRQPTEMRKPAENRR